MQPISRSTLQHAFAAAIAEKERLIQREQELKGQLAAEDFHKEIRRIAALGKVQHAISKPVPFGVIFDNMLSYTKTWFFDCDVTTIRSVESPSLMTIRVGWEPKERVEDPRILERRLEKETSW
jgi:hypothetical protein